MIRIGILGANGRMGQSILSALDVENKIALGCALVRKGHPLDATQIPLVLKTGQAHYYESDIDAGFSNSNVMIDFTLPEAAHEHLVIAQTLMKPMVIGTTGLRPKDHQLMASVAKSVPILYDTNMSFGISVLSTLVEQASKVLGADFDCDITEMHHRHKKDLPSGTALSLGKAVARGRGVLLADHGTRRYDTDGDHRLQTNHEFAEGEIGFSAQRGGGVFGDHDVIFTSQNEQIIVRHRALNRSVFANGALKAAQWITTQSPGLYSLKDVLND